MKRWMIFGVVLAILLLLPGAVAATTVTVFLNNNGAELTDPQYFISIAGIGRFRSGDTFTVATPGTITVTTWTGSSIRGSPTVINLAADQNQLAIEYATVLVSLTGSNGVTLTDTTRYYVDIMGIGKKGTGDVFDVPDGAQIYFKACTNSICGPFNLESFAAGERELPFEYSTVTVSLYNGATDLTDDPFYLDITDIGKVWDGGWFYVPEGGMVSYKAVTEFVLGSPISGPELETTFATGDQSLDYEYATVKVRLYSGPTELTTVDYYLEIQDMDVMYYNDEFEVPAGAVITYRACRAPAICGPWQTRSFVAGDQTLGVEYATVTVTLVNGATQLLDKSMYSLEVEGIGHLTYGDKFTVPMSTEINYRAWTNSIVGPWQMTTYYAASNTLRYEYATVKFVFDLSGGSCTLQTRVNGITTPVANGGKIHVPWSTDVSYRADICGWLSTARISRFHTGEGTVTWSLTSAYV